MIKNLENGISFLKISEKPIDLPCVTTGARYPSQLQLPCSCSPTEAQLRRIVPNRKTSDRTSQIGMQTLVQPPAEGLPDFAGWMATVVTVCALATFVGGCYSVAVTDDSEDETTSYLELEVVPATATIYIDDEYHGVVEGWRHQVVPIAPGHRRLELRADGYITQRFDLEVQKDSWLTLRVKLERTIDVPSNPGSDEDSEPFPMPTHPTAPEPDS